MAPGKIQKKSKKVQREPEEVQPQVETNDSDVEKVDGDEVDSLRSSSSEPEGREGSDGGEVESESDADGFDEPRAAKRRRMSDVEDDEDEPYVAAAPPQAISRIKKAKTSNDKTTSSSTADPITIADAISSDPQRDSAHPLFATLNPELQTTSTTFTPLGVAPWLVTSLSNMAIRRPTAIQKACIPEILAGRDCIGGSRTGSGKTMAFAVPILQEWAKDPVGIFALVLTPTRELALQIFEQFKAISSTQSLKPLLITGGNDMRSQAILLSQRPHIVIATPGRLADHIQNSGADTVSGLKRTRVVVLDEADRLLNSNAGPGSMLPDVETCLGALPGPKDRQTLLFTATVTDEVRALKEMPRQPGKPPIFVTEIQAFTSKPSATNPNDTTTSSSAPESILPPTLSQSYILTPLSHRDAYLHVLLTALPTETYSSIIIFVNRTSTATLLSSTLRHLGHSLTSLHSGLPQHERNANLARFRSMGVRILVATDVAARGLDIPNVNLVVNREVPRDPSDYIHRVGRTARAGRSGEAITLVGQRDVELFQAVEARVFGYEEAEDTKEERGARPQIKAFEVEGVNLDARILKDGVLREVSKALREARIETEEGRDWRGRRKGGVRKLAK